MNAGVASLALMLVATFGCFSYMKDNQKQPMVGSKMIITITKDGKGGYNIDNDITTEKDSKLGYKLSSLVSHELNGAELVDISGGGL
jgi:hypothetical protein